MDVKELRIGNCIAIQIGPENIPVGVWAINKSPNSEYMIVIRDCLERGWFTASVTEFTPIELTEDIFIKAGFKRVKVKGGYNTSDGFEDDNLTFYLEENGWVYCISFEDGDRMNRMQELSIPIKYIHQLQNMYFALIGEELRIKL